MDDQLTSLIDDDTNIKPQPASKKNDSDSKSQEEPEEKDEVSELSNGHSLIQKEAEEDIHIVETNIVEEMQKSYLDYAMSVIVSRALPDVRDGLKPVQRRIIYAMQDQSMTSTAKFHKCAAVVGEVLKKYHPHGDISVYDALVRMGQDWTLRYPLVVPQGNFGSVDGDPPAAMRYTECKLHKIADELYADIDKETVRFDLNDLQNEEPIFLPSVLPNLLLNGASGIAVGMATNIPPHNLGEIIDGLNLLIERQDLLETGKTKDVEVKLFDGKQASFTVKVAGTDFSSSATVEDLVKFIKGPDFPTGGTIYDQKELIQMYATGKGRVVTRAKMDVEEIKGGRFRLVVTEIPYQINKSTLVSKIADLVKLKKIEGISDLRDESNKKGMRITIELKKDVVVKKIQNQLYKFTQLQSTFNTNMVALLDNEPKLMTLKTMLQEFIKHRQQIIIKRTLYLLRRAKEREHILQGLKIAIDNIDEVIKLIRASKDAETAKTSLMKKFGLTEIQSQAILDMQLRKLAALERQKIEEELKEIINTIKGFEELLVSPIKVLAKVQEELLVLKEKYGDKRITQVIKGKLGDLSDEDLIVDEKCIVTISENGYIKRLKEDTYTKQSRGGKGKIGQTLREDDQVSTIKLCSSHDWALFFTNIGKVYKLRVWEIPESSRIAKGTPIVNFLSMQPNERVEAFFALTTEQMDNAQGFVFFVTESGKVKKTPLEEYANIRSSGIAAISLQDGDNLVFAGLVDEDEDVLLTTSEGQSIRFKGSDARPMGRTAAGVAGIKLSKKDDRVVGTVIIPKGSKDILLLTVAKGGYGKKTPVTEYKVQNRSGSGILTYKVTEKTGQLVAARAVTKGSESDLLIATTSGKIIRLGTKEIPTLNRATQGVRLIKLDGTDKVISVAILEEDLGTDIEGEVGEE